MTSMPGWWLKKREAFRLKKEAKLASRRVEWTHSPEPDESLGPVELYTPNEKPTSWYQFCTDRKYAYESRGDEVAALVWWSMRWWDQKEIGHEDDPCTESGWQNLCAYWNYKAEGYESENLSL